MFVTVRRWANKLEPTGVHSKHVLLLSQFYRLNDDHHDDDVSIRNPKESTGDLVISTDQSTTVVGSSRERAGGPEEAETDLFFSVLSSC